MQDSFKILIIQFFGGKRNIKSTRMLKIRSLYAETIKGWQIYFDDYVIGHVVLV